MDGAPHNCLAMGGIPHGGELPTGLLIIHAHIIIPSLNPTNFKPAMPEASMPLSKQARFQHSEATRAHQLKRGRATWARERAC